MSVHQCSALPFSRHFSARLNFKLKSASAKLQLSLACWPPEVGAAQPDDVWLDSAGRYRQDDTPGREQLVHWPILLVTIPGAASEGRSFAMT